MSTPDRIGDYEILGELGRGAMGVVYRARKASLPDREVALKEVALGIGGEERSRKMIEARALLRMQSLHIVTLLDVFESSERSSLLIVMERLRPETLRDRLTALGAPMEADSAMEVTDGLLDALEAAHGNVGDDGQPRPIVHRDLKPENVGYQDWRGSEIVKVMDFGVADIADGQDGGRESRSSARAFKAFTPAYVSPEVLAGQDAAPASDLYALGLIAWEMLAGRHPFSDARGRLPAALVVQSRIAQEEVPHLPEHLVPRLPEALVDLVKDLCARDPALRPTAHESHERLRRARGAAMAATSASGRRSGPRPAVPAPPPRAARSRAGLWVVFAAVSVILGGAVAAWFWTRPAPVTPLPIPQPILGPVVGPTLPVVAPPEQPRTPIDVQIGSDVPVVGVSAQALSPGSYRCRLDQGTPAACTLTLVGGTEEFPSYRLRSTSGDPLVDGTVSRQGGSAYAFEGRLLSGGDRVPVASARGDLVADARNSGLAGTLSSTWSPGRVGPPSLRLELSR